MASYTRFFICFRENRGIKGWIETGKLEQIMAQREVEREFWHLFSCCSSNHLKYLSDNIYFSNSPWENVCPSVTFTTANQFHSPPHQVVRRYPTPPTASISLPSEHSHFVLLWNPPQSVWEWNPQPLGEERKGPVVRKWCSSQGGKPWARCAVVTPDRKFKLFTERCKMIKMTGPQYLSRKIK